MEEHDISLVILSWSGPRFATDYLFGNDIDGIGEACSVPTMAAHLVRPWNRLVVVVGDTHSEWRLDAGVALLAADDEAEIVIATAAGRSDEGRSAVEHLRPDDAIIAPAHVLHDLAPRAGWRVIRKLEDANLIVVGGPHRLSTSRGVTRRTFAATSTRPTVEPA